jgi:hypothetical protein
LDTGPGATACDPVLNALARTTRHSVLNTRCTCPSGHAIFDPTAAIATRQSIFNARPSTPLIGSGGVLAGFEREARCISIQDRLSILTHLKAQA